MKIALDYDKTYSLDPDFWKAFLVVCKKHGHECHIVTVRDERFDRTAPLVEAERHFQVHYTRGVSKRHVLTADPLSSAFIPDVWIDDRPETIGDNSMTTREQLIVWRAMRGEGDTIPLEE